MSGVHDDLARLRSPIAHWSDREGAARRVEAEIARLRELVDGYAVDSSQHRERAEAAEARCARLQQALIEHRALIVIDEDGAAEAIDMEAWGPVWIRGSEALAGLDTPADSRSPFPRPVLQSGEAGLFGHEHYPGAPADSQPEDGTA